MLTSVLKFSGDKINSVNFYMYMHIESLSTNMTHNIISFILMQLTLMIAYLSDPETTDGLYS